MDNGMRCTKEDKRLYLINALNVSKPNFVSGFVTNCPTAISNSTFRQIAIDQFKITLSMPRNIPRQTYRTFHEHLRKYHQYNFCQILLKFVRNDLCTKPHKIFVPSRVIVKLIWQQIENSTCDHISAMLSIFHDRVVIKICTKFVVILTLQGAAMSKIMIFLICFDGFLMDGFSLSISIVELGYDDLYS